MKHTEQQSAYEREVELTKLEAKIEHDPLLLARVVIAESAESNIELTEHSLRSWVAKLLPHVLEGGHGGEYALLVCLRTIRAYKRLEQQLAGKEKTDERKAG